MRRFAIDQQMATFSRCRIITAAFLLLLQLIGAQAHLTQTPWNSIVSKEDASVFTCCSDIQKTIFWKHKPIQSTAASDIYDSSGFVNGYLTSGRFKITPGSRPGCVNLLITNVSRGDAGTYICTDDAGLGQWKGWELVILETFDCQEENRRAEYMGVNDFGLPQDVISTECISKYFGNVPLKITCEWSSGAKLFDNNQHSKVSNLTTTLNIQMAAMKQFNGDRLLCYAEIDGETSARQSPASWRSSHLTIHYATFHQRVVSQCSVDELSLDCHPPCNVKATHFSNGSSYCEITYSHQINQKVYILLEVKGTQYEQPNPPAIGNRELIQNAHGEVGNVGLPIGLKVYPSNNQLQRSPYVKKKNCPETMPFLKGGGISTARSKSAIFLFGCDEGSAFPRRKSTA